MLATEACDNCTTENMLRRLDAPMNLSLSKVFAQPNLATHAIDLPTHGSALLRPLQASDVDELATFLEGLSPATRRFSTFPSYDLAAAQELCEAINRYDKLQLIVELVPAGRIIGLFEFSFDLPEHDQQRYRQQGVPLDPSVDCRFGPTVADEFQNQKVGSRVFPHIVDIAKQFGKKRIILWGGVLSDNARAIRYYEKQGFRPLATFVAQDGEEILDMMLEL
jgi:GNAT superfamily N-acetyltransferase